MENSTETNMNMNMKSNKAMMTMKRTKTIKPDNQSNCPKNKKIVKNVGEKKRRVMRAKSVCKKWEVLTEEEMEKHEATYVTCRTCRKSVRPRSVHASESTGGDYVCLKCNCGIYISHFCLNCKIEDLY